MEIPTDEPISVQCPHCEQFKETDPIHENEAARSTNCPDCGGWFKIHNGESVLVETKDKSA